MMILDEENTSLAKNLCRLNAEIKEKQKEYMLLCNLLKTIIKDHDDIYDKDGIQIITYATHTKNLFDLQSFKQLYPELYESFCEKKQIRNLNVKQTGLDDDKN